MLPLMAPLFCTRNPDCVMGGSVPVLSCMLICQFPESDPDGGTFLLLLLPQALRNNESSISKDVILHCIGLASSVVLYYQLRFNSRVGLRFAKIFRQACRGIYHRRPRKGNVKDGSRGLAARLPAD